MRQLREARAGLDQRYEALSVHALFNDGGHWAVPASQRKCSKGIGDAIRQPDIYPVDRPRRQLHDAVISAPSTWEPGSSTC